MPRKSIRPNISASMCFSLSPVLSSMFQTRLEGALGRVQQQGTGVIDIEALHLCQAVQNPLFLLHQCRGAGHAGGSRLADGKAFTAELILSYEIVAGCPAGQFAILPETQGHPRAVDDTAAQDVLDHPFSALQQAGRIAPAAQQLLASNLDAYPLRIGHAAHVIPADFIAQLQTNRRLIPGQVFTFVITGLPGLHGQLTLVQAIEFQLSLLGPQRPERLIARRAAGLDERTGRYAQEVLHAVQQQTGLIALEPEAGLFLLLPFSIPVLSLHIAGAGGTNGLLQLSLLPADLQLECFAFTLNPDRQLAAAQLGAEGGVRVPGLIFRGAAAGQKDAQHRPSQPCDCLHAVVSCWSTRGTPAALTTAQKDEPGWARKSRSSGVDSRPRTALRCG